LGQLAVGLAVLAALVTGVPAVGAGLLSPVELAVVVLTPLAAFEATSLLPAAAIQVQRSRAAASRILTLLDSPAGSPSDVPTGPTPDAPVPAGPPLTAAGLAIGWPGGPLLAEGLDLVLDSGRSVAIVGPSGTGKTTALLTLAGLLPRRGGSLTLGGQDIDRVARAAVVRAVVVGTEDAHVFGTTVLENLRVARGDVTAAEATAVLARVGLGDWLGGLPDGLETLLGPDARTVSGGERRRLLVARTLLSPTALLLLDEPAEHLDPVRADALVEDLLRDPRGVVVVTHRLTPLAAADEVLWLQDGRIRARGTHAELTATSPGYREALDRERAGEETEAGRAR
ncbi:ATP-binding cassette domain-containing protein, partial [uncultured Cellulomonas sp.]|uniref:ATP-binding cassette domain-containing protein n=1 Tax=uncultured Cellulomonas sp. TaxID=189682 RepID=UPI0028EFB2E0